MQSPDAQRVVESLRKGIPPDGHVCQFTVGRATEMEELTAKLQSADGGSLLLQANYGSGKTHLLRFVRETALEMGYVVSLIALDAKGQVRFNRMDQVFGAICRNIEVPKKKPGKGIRQLLDESRYGLEWEDAKFWREVTNGGRWDLSEALDSPAMFVALRAWHTEEPDAQDLVEDWLCQPWTYRSQRKRLFTELVLGLRRHFLDPRPAWKFYNDGVFEFHTQGYAQCWAALRDIRHLATSCGYRGFILLFDEYEDVITNISRINHQEAAFWNLFQFYTGKSFPGVSFYAVTPEFVAKCKTLLLTKNRYDFDYELFDRIPTFQMAPLERDELRELAERIVAAHGTAYSWEPEAIVDRGELDRVLQAATAVPVQDRTRQTIRQIVAHLDDALEDCG